MPGKQAGVSATVGQCVSYSKNIIYVNIFSFSALNSYGD